MHSNLLGIGVSFDNILIWGTTSLTLKGFAIYVMDNKFNALTKTSDSICPIYEQLKEYYWSWRPKLYDDTDSS